MASGFDPLSFGEEQDLQDLTAQLDAQLGADPLTAAGPAQAAGADDAHSYGALLAPAAAPAVAAVQAPPPAPPEAEAPAAAPMPVGPLPVPAAAPAPGEGFEAFASPRLPAAPQRELPLRVSVSDPRRVATSGGGLLGMKTSHVEYCVTSRSSLPGWANAEVSVTRRFRDFVALSELLKAAFRGHFVPSRPEKNAVEGSRMSDAFVEARRAGLHKYLTQLAAHPVIGRSEELKAFLETPGELSSNLRWAGMLPASASIMEGTAKFSMQLIGRESKVVDPVAAAQPAARSKDLMRAMKEAAQGMRGGREVPLEELDLRRLREAAEEMREQLGLTSKAAEKLVAKLDQLGAGAGDLGLSLFKVAKFEEAEGGALASYTGTLRFSSGLIADQKRAAAALVRVSKMMAKVTGRIALELGTLHDNLAAMPAAVRGYMSREHQMLTWHTLAGDLEAKQRALAEADKSKAKRVDELRADVSCLELSVGAAKAQYERIKAANLSETARFAAERRGAYADMLEAFTATQVAACERCAEVWVQLAAELGASPEQLAAVRTPSSSSLLGTAPQPPLP